MIVTHTFRVSGKCPVSDSTDYYTVKVTLDQPVKVEDIKAITAECLAKSVFQEDFTQLLANRLAPAEVTTTCLHGDVETVAKQIV